MLNIPIKAREALKSGYFRKNYRFEIEATETESAFVIENDNLVSESVSINEKMCSSEELKFGLCEGSTLEFIYFDKPNITGRHIKAILQCEYRDEDGELQWQEIPMGFFDVEQCARQAATGAIKATCFNKLKSEYLDQKANDQIQEVIAAGESGLTNTVSMYTLLNKLLENYSIDQFDEEELETIQMWSPTFNINQTSLKIYKYDSSGNYTDTGYYLINIYVSDYLTCAGFSGSEYYAFDISAKDTCEFIFDMAYEQIKRYTGVNKDSVRVYVSGRYMTLEYLSRTGYSQTGMWIGEIGFRKKKYSGTSAGEMYLKFKKIGAMKNEDETWGWYTNILNGAEIKIPLLFAMSTSSSTTITEQMKRQAKENYKEILQEFKPIKIRHKMLSNIEKMRVTSEQFAVQNTDITIRELQSSVFEVNTQYGQLDRESDLFRGVVLNSSRLYPADTLMPAGTLYPRSESENATKASYSNLWADEGNVRRFKYLIITYKGLDDDGNEVDKTLQRTVNEHGTDNYNMSNNWLFRNLVWTADQVAVYADQMAELLRDVRWFPFELWGAGLPYIETGDEIEINTAGGTYVSYILNRTLHGIQNLQDTFQNGVLNIF